jgi:2',3'-cyclic-nucleotide 2'-phosphodiesterase (5'-nucleotidase family)
VSGVKGITIVHSADLHGALDFELSDRLASFKPEDGLHLNAGDSVKSGNLAFPLKADRAWSMLVRAKCDVGVPGNREIHISEAGFHAKLRGCGHTLVCANLFDREGRLVLPPSVVLEVGGVRVGVVGAMVPFLTRHMKMYKTSAYVWEQPLECAVRAAETLREHVDCLIALTHTGLQTDRELAAAYGKFDLIVGGHSHTKMVEPLAVNGVPILHCGAHGHLAGVYRWTSEGGLVDWRWETLKEPMRRGA